MLGKESNFPGLRTTPQQLCSCAPGDEEAGGPARAERKWRWSWLIFLSTAALSTRHHSVPAGIAQPEPGTLWKGRSSVREILKRRAAQAYSPADARSGLSRA